LLNPTIVVEVLSPSTEVYDRGDKAEFYRQHEAIRELLLVAQDTKWIAHYSRQAEGQWLVTEITEQDAVVDLPSIGCTLRMADVYAKVKLPS